MLSLYAYRFHGSFTLPGTDTETDTASKKRYKSNQFMHQNQISDGLGGLPRPSKIFAMLMWMVYETIQDRPHQHSKFGVFQDPPDTNKMCIKPVVICIGLIGTVISLGIGLSVDQCKHTIKQEYIPVGCVLPTLYHTGGLPGRDPPVQRPPRQRTHLDRDLPDIDSTWTDKHP